MDPTPFKLLLTKQTRPSMGEPKEGRIRRGLGFKVWGLGFKGKRAGRWGVEFRFCFFRVTVRSLEVSGSVLKGLLGSGLRVSGSVSARCSWCGKTKIGFRVFSLVTTHQ